jgi:hypothetical protein
MADGPDGKVSSQPVSGRVSGGLKLGLILLRRGDQSRYLAALLSSGASFAAAMSTAELTGTPPRIPGGARASGLDAGAAAARRLPAVLTSLLLIVVLYAAFEHGAVALPAEARLQVVIAALAAAAGAA